MANVRWVGDRSAVAQVDTATVTAAGSGGTTFKITHDTTANFVSYLSVSGDTVTSIAAALGAAIQAAAAGPAPEFSDFNVSLSAGVLTVTGPPDGASFTWTTNASGGAGTIGARTSVTAAKSPHDLNDGSNYDTGSLPSATDTLIFENGSVDALYNATALAAIALSKVIRRATFTGRLGLPRIAENGGYQQFRVRYISLQAATMEFEVANQDGPGQMQIKVSGASATSFSCIANPQPSSQGNEPVLVYGFVSTSSLYVVGGGVNVCPETGQTAVIPTITATVAQVTIGGGATLTTLNLNGCSANILASYTTLNVDRGGVIRIGDVASGTTTIVQQGTIVWQSNASFGNLTIGNQGLFDMTFGVAVVSAGTITMNLDAELRDPNARIVKPFDVTLQDCAMTGVKIDAGTGHTLTVAA